MGQKPFHKFFSISPGASGGERMSPSKRQQELLKVLCHRRHDTYDNLSFEFHISRRTICRDVAILMCSYPIESLPSFEMCTSLSIPTALIFSQPFETPVGCFRAIPLKIPCGIIKVVFYHLPPLFNWYMELRSETHPQEGGNGFPFTRLSDVSPAFVLMNRPMSGKMKKAKTSLVVEKLTVTNQSLKIRGIVRRRYIWRDESVNHWRYQYKRATTADDRLLPSWNALNGYFIIIL